MKQTIRLTESELRNIIKKKIMESMLPGEEEKNEQRRQLFAKAYHSVEQSIKDVEEAIRFSRKMFDDGYNGPADGDEISVGQYVWGLLRDALSILGQGGRRTINDYEIDKRNYWRAKNWWGEGDDIIGDEIDPYTTKDVRNYRNHLYNH